MKDNSWLMSSILDFVSAIIAFVSAIFFFNDLKTMGIIFLGCALIVLIIGFIFLIKSFKK